MPAEQPKWSLGQWARENIVVLGSSFVVALAVVRLAQASRGNSTTAVAILGYAGTGNVLFAALAEVVPMAVALGATFATLMAIHRKALHTWGSLAIVLVVLALNIVSISAWILSIPLGIAYFRPAVRSADLRKASLISVVALTGAIVLSMMFGEHMWLPAEKIAVDNRPPLVGYVLSSDGDEVVVLLERDRTVQVMGRQEVKGRELCEIRAGHFIDAVFRDDRIIDVFASASKRRPKYEKCPG